MGAFSERVSKAQSCIPEAELEIWLKRAPKTRTKSHRKGGGEPWRPHTIKNYLNANIAGNKFLIHMGWFDAAAPPESRWTPERIEAFITRPKSNGNSYAPQTIINHLVGIYSFQKVIASHANHRALLAPLLRIKRENVRKIHVADPDDLIKRATSIMQVAVDSMPAGWTDKVIAPSIKKQATHWAIRFRVGFQIAWFTHLTTRITNMTETELGKENNLFRPNEDDQLNNLSESDIWWLLYSRKVTKNRRKYDRLLPVELIPWLKKYLKFVRPILCCGNYKGHQKYEGNRLWISSRGAPQSQGSIRKDVKASTAKLVEGGIPPHSIRHSVVTAISKKDPSNSSRASWILSNDPDTMNFSYNKAGRAPARKLAMQRLRQLAHAPKSEN